MESNFSAEEDDGYVSPTFDLSDHSSDEDEGKVFVAQPVVAAAGGRKNKKRRIEREEVAMDEGDLEALALKAMGL